MQFNFEEVHNYYERVVFEEVARRSEYFPQYNHNMLIDVACVALNQLPARYVRHDVDLIFYMTPADRQEIDRKVDEALTFAFRFVGERIHEAPG
jgi:predicted Co/Zn/Cd cation transporter (cation efflux family)